MILQKLYEYAQREDLLADTAFEKRKVDWIIRVRIDGTIDGVERGLEYPIVIPARLKRSGNDPKAHFLADNAKFVLGVERDPKKLPNTAYLKKSKSSFASQIRNAADSTNDQQLRAICSALDTLSTSMFSQADPPTHFQEFTFKVWDNAANDFVLITENVAAKAWWRSLHSKLSGTSRRKSTGDTELHKFLGRCLVTGKVQEIAAIHTVRVKGLGDATSVVSFEKDAFRSFGLEHSYNAPVSKDAMLGYTLALNRLLERDEATRRNLVLPGELTVCMFLGGRTKLASDEVDAAAVLIGKLDPDEEQALEIGDSLQWGATKSLFDAPYKGRNSAPLNDTRPLFILALTPNAGRAVVREWFEGTVSNVASSVEQYFRDLAIVDPFTQSIRAYFMLRTPSGKAKREAGEEAVSATAGTKRKPEGLLDALRAKDRRGRNVGDIPADLSRQFVLTALDSCRRFPLTVLETAVRRIRAEAAGQQYGAVSVNRAALIKAYLNRELRLERSPLLSQFQSQDPNFKEVQVSLDPNCRIPAYLLGRLMAVMEQAQQVAMKRPDDKEKWKGATIVDRAYGAASAAPATIMSRLLRGVRHHLSKVKSETEGYEVRYEKLLDQICGNFETPETAFPKALTLQQQGMFSLGYYQQRADLFKKKDVDAEVAISE